MNYKSFETFVWLLLPSLIWGITNPLLKKGGLGIEDIKGKNNIHQLLMKIKFIVVQWRCFLPFAINQLGSICYFYAVKNTDISLAVPVVNSLTLIFSSLSGKLLNLEEYSLSTYCGMLLIVIGVSLCMLN